MRRGLISWSELEVPRAVLDARLDRVRTSMREAQLDALLLYTNIARPAGVTYLTQFVPYWSHGLLVVLADPTPPTLIVALSKRVSGWIEETSYRGEVISTPEVGATAAKAILRARPATTRVGVVELDRLPTDVSKSLGRELNSVRLEDATALFADVRAIADDAEVRLARHAVSIANRAIALARETRTGDSATLIAVLDGESRRLGAEEVLVTMAPNLDDDLRLRRIEGHQPLGQRRAIRVSLAYKGQWVRLTRTLCTETNDRETAAQLETWMHRELCSVTNGVDARLALQTQAEQLPGLTILDCTWQGARSGLPLASLDSLQPGSLVNADLCVRFRERQWRLGDPLHLAAGLNTPAQLLGT